MTIASIHYSYNQFLIKFNLRNTFIEEIYYPLAPEKKNIGNLNLFI